MLVRFRSNTTQHIMSSAHPTLRLHTYFRSSCSGRLRIALALKELDVQHVTINLLEKKQLSDDFRSLNASASVPVLTDLSNDDFPIGQSIAALEYLEEAYPDRRALLPPLSDPLKRAKVRVLVNIIACDTQPVSNLRVSEDVRAMGADSTEWMKRWIRRGLSAYEETLSSTAGEYSVGDEITLADVCLVPAIWGAERFGVDMSSMQNVMRVYNVLKSNEAVVSSHWKNQIDTPGHLRS